jgi:ubiquinone/menaquinone biosynthesis C-methylase UbiE
MTYHSGNQMVDPFVLFDKAQLRAGMHIADFGCGHTGHLVFPASPLIGGHGIVYAVDILKDVLAAVKKRCEMNNITNMQTVWSDVEKVGKTAIPAKSLDIAFVVNSLVQSKDRNSFLQEVGRLLKNKARLIIVDWFKKGLAFGPRDNDFVDFEEIKKIAKQLGFYLQEEFFVGPYHKGLIFYKHE